MIHTVRQAAVRRMEAVVAVRRSGVHEAQWKSRVMGPEQEQGEGGTEGRGRVGARSSQKKGSRADGHSGGPIGGSGR